MEQKKNNRCTQMQIQLLQKYMANNKTISTTVTKSTLSTMEANRRAREWSALRSLLRKHGPDKSVEKWKQTWRDLKRKHRKQKLEASSIKLESKTKQNKEKNCEITNIDCDTILETTKVYVDPLESVVEGDASIKEEPSMSPVEIELPSINVNLNIPCSSPMQVVLTNAESFNPTSSTSTQTSSKFLPPCCAYTTQNQPSVCAHNSSTPATQCNSQCCHHNVPAYISETNSLQIQQNALLQRLSNLLEEQNLNLRMRNMIERHKMRFQLRRRF